MSTRIEYTASEVQDIQQLESYLASQGVSTDDISVIMAGLDGNADTEIPDDLKAAYLNLTMLKLWAMIDPDTYQAAYGQIGPDINRGDPNALFDAMDDYLSPEMQDFLERMINDSPELMAVAAENDNDPKTTIDAVFAAIAKAREEGDGDLEDVWTNEDGQQVIDDMGLEGTFYESILNQSDTYKNIQGIALTEMAKYQDFLTTLFTEGVASGDVTVEEAQAQAGQISAMMNMWTGIYNQAVDQDSNLFQFLGSVMKAEADLLDSLARNVATR